MRLNLGNDPQEPGTLQKSYDQIVGEANHAEPKKDNDPDTSYLGPILFAVLTLAGVLATLAFIVANKPG